MKYFKYLISHPRKLMWSIIAILFYVAVLIVSHIQVEDLFTELAIAILSTIGLIVALLQPYKEYRV